MDIGLAHINKYPKSRYYDGSRCRFLGADDPQMLKLTKNTKDGLNLFAYCNNDPVSFTDPTGRFLGTLSVIGISGCKLVRYYKVPKSKGCKSVLSGIVIVGAGVSDFIGAKGWRFDGYTAYPYWKLTSAYCFNGTSNKVH